MLMINLLWYKKPLRLAYPSHGITLTIFYLI